MASQFLVCSEHPAYDLRSSLRTLNSLRHLPWKNLLNKIYCLPFAIQTQAWAIEVPAC